MTGRRLLVVQPYVPSYRQPLWDGVTRLFSERGIECVVAAGVPDEVQSQRADVAPGRQTIRTPSHSVGVRGTRLRWQSSWRLWGDFDAIVLEASGSLLDTSVALARGVPTILFGHIGSFVKSPRALDLRLERWQLNRASGVLAYTAEGAAAAASHGVSPDRVQVLNNTVATGAVLREIARLDRASSLSILGLRDDPGVERLCYIGGLDEAKRIDLLVEALDILHRERPSVRLVVGGSGSMVSLLDRAVARGQVEMVGRVDDVQKAALSFVAEGILMPGRVGLVAVESFALGLPIITTRGEGHAPEFAYLTPGSDSLVADRTAHSIAEHVEKFLQDPALRDSMQQAARAKAGWPRMADMQQEFVDGCIRLLTWGG